MFASGQDWHGGGRSGYVPIDCNFQGKTIAQRTAGQINPHVGYWPFGFPFFSNIIPITANPAGGSTMQFTGGTVTLQALRRDLELYGRPSSGRQFWRADGRQFGADLQYLFSLGKWFPSSNPHTESDSHCAGRGHLRGEFGLLLSTLVRFFHSTVYGCAQLHSSQGRWVCCGSTMDQSRRGVWHSGYLWEHHFFCRLRWKKRDPLSDWEDHPRPSQPRLSLPPRMRREAPELSLRSPLLHRQIRRNMRLTTSVGISPDNLSPSQTRTRSTRETRWKVWYLARPGAIPAFLPSLMYPPAPGCLIRIGIPQLTSPTIYFGAWCCQYRVMATTLGTEKRGILSTTFIFPQPGPARIPIHTWALSQETSSIRNPMSAPSSGGLWAVFPWAPCVFGDNCAPTTVSGAPPDWDNGVSPGSDGPLDQ